MKYNFPKNWTPVDKTPLEFAKINAEVFELEQPAESLEKELYRELCGEHILFGCNVEAIAYSKENLNDILFKIDESENYALVHLTWSKESSPKFPFTKKYGSYEEFKNEMDKI